ncbi:leucyl aminopeptidase [Sanguibacter gelidistatuariae]|uniref:Probable cytosol aminopeptidase n=1 Tax=Sanguibacter gelidistatuariae TaxID=1814289 RepID=A0A1G6U957_9MICO|nr:leucyl aminopeptidase [Sanguibacter gelidistatuariae]SDD37920.1 leucyl aminopeptidase [Sanguibacter gelidistatuariae]
MTAGQHRLIPETFSPAPSREVLEGLVVSVVEAVGADVQAAGYPVAIGGAIPAEIGLDWAELGHVGFEGKVGQTFVLARHDATSVVAVGIGEADALDAAALRDVAAAFARAAARYETVALVLPEAPAVPLDVVGQVVVEGALLARYRYNALKTAPKDVALTSVEIVATTDRQAVVTGAERGMIISAAASLSRDLANTPPGHLTAADLGDLALAIGPEHGVEVTTFDKAQLIELGCGGLLGVNAGSTDEPRMIQLRYTPTDADGVRLAPSGTLALVGKGIMYDSGGISLKPSDPMHLAMKMDMSGAAAVLAALTALRGLGCTTAVTAFLMCTDNMPSGSATKLGDVLTIRNGTTVEVKNTDAEGRLVMSDALVLAAEEAPDAIIDIATLTGAALVALGSATAAVLGNNQDLIDQARAASATSDERIWQLPLEHRYREQLNSDIADISNMGGKFAGATTAALFLAEFVDGIPWAHIDIAGTMQSDTDDSWRSRGATGFGARLLIDLALNFRVPTA